MATKDSDGNSIVTFNISQSLIDYLLKEKFIDKIYDKNFGYERILIHKFKVLGGSIESLKNHLMINDIIEI